MGLKPQVAYVSGEYAYMCSVTLLDERRPGS
jgi:hypothetical protein